MNADAQRDGDTWALHLFDLQQRGFVPEAVVADAQMVLNEQVRNSILQVVHR